LLLGLLLATFGSHSSVSTAVQGRYPISLCALFNTPVDNLQELLNIFKFNKKVIYSIFICLFSYIKFFLIFANHFSFYLFFL